jgi:general bacterial porin, GBP family
VSVAATYVFSGLTIGAGYLQLDHPNSTLNTSGAVGGGSSTTGDDYSGNLFYGIDGGVANQKISVAGLSYQRGVLTAGFGFSHTLLNYNDGAIRTFNNYDLSLQARLSPALILIGDYTYTDAKFSDLPTYRGELKPKWHQLTLAADYAISKRTDFYTSASYQLAAGDGGVLVGNSYQPIAQIKTAGTSSASNRQVSVQIGMRHRF